MSDSLEIKLKDKLTSGSEPDWTNLAWERFSKGKERVPNKKPGFKKNI